MAEGLKSLLTTEFELVGIVEDGIALIKAARDLRPDVIIADITMPHLNGIEALMRLKQDNPQVRVVFLTMHMEMAYVRRALEVGALGYVLKHSAPSELIAAVRAAQKGRTWLAPELSGELLQSSKRAPAQTGDPATSLTPRQREILQLLAAGRSAKEIGAALNVSSRTVEFHKYQMMERLDLHTTAELTRYAIREGIVEI
jgi:DNA-binding NarL/FixJ family response regulator